MSWKFFKTFLKNPREVGAILPSSSFLAKAITSGLGPLSDSDVIMEFGPGTGVLTRKIHDILEHKKNYIGIEVNSHFTEELCKKFPDLAFINDSAEKAYTIVEKLHPLPDPLPSRERENNMRVKAVISGLPFASLPEKIQDGIIHSIHKLLSPGFVFRTFQYVHGYPLPLAKKFRKKMTHLFGHEPQKKMVIQNIPPAYVLTWQCPMSHTA